MTQFVELAIFLITAYCCNGLPWLASDSGTKPFFGLASPDKYATVASNSATRWTCAFNETLVLYTVWVDPKSKSKSKVIKSPKLRPTTRARCCPNPGAEEHLIPGEICPLGQIDGEDNFLLPRNLSWAPPLPPCTESASSRPACCSEDSQSYCQFIHDRTPQGEICPFGRPVCCRRGRDQVPFQVNAKSICTDVVVENTSDSDSEAPTPTDAQTMLTPRLKKFRDWIKDKGNKKPAIPRKPYYRPPQNETFV